MIITIDGPAGAGKTTVAKILADKLGFIFWESGALYRAITYKAMQKGVNLDDEDAVCEMMRNSQLELRSPCGLRPATSAQEAATPQQPVESPNTTSSGARTFLDGHDVSEEIKTPRVTKQVWRIARSPKVRELLLTMQRKMAEGKNLVAEGRDMGTVVFPFAEKKFYLDGAIDERSRRRYKELCEKGEAVSPEEVLRDMEERDRTDITRDVAPLRKAPDAIYVDTTAMTVEQVVDHLLHQLKPICTHNGIDFKNGCEA